MSRVGTAQDAVNVAGRPAILIDEVGGIRHEAAARHEEPECVDRGQAVAGRERDDEIAILDGCTVRWQHQTSVWLTRKRLDGTLDVSRAPHSNGQDIDRQRWRYRPGCPQEVIEVGGIGIPDERGAPDRGRDLLEHREPLSGNACFIILEARKIATWLRQTGNEARTDRIGDSYEHDGGR